MTLLGGGAAEVLHVEARGVCLECAGKDAQSLPVPNP